MPDRELVRLRPRRARGLASRPGRERRRGDRRPELHLDDPEWSEPVEDGERRMFAGFLQPAGLVDGPLQLTPDDGPDRWIGRQPVSANVDLWIVGRDGRTTTTSAEVDLSPGWG